MRIRLKPVQICTGFWVLFLCIPCIATDIATPSHQIALHHGVIIDYTSPSIQSGGTLTELNYLGQWTTTTINLGIGKSRYQLSYSDNDNDLSLYSNINSYYKGHIEALALGGHTHLGAEIFSSTSTLFNFNMGIDWPLLSDCTIGAFIRTSANSVSLEYQEGSDTLHYTFSPRVTAVGTKIQGTQFGEYTLEISSLKLSHSGSATHYIDIDGYGSEYKGTLQLPITPFGIFKVSGLHTQINDIQGGVYETTQLGRFKADHVTQRDIILTNSHPGFVWGIRETQVDSRNLYAASTSQASGSWSSLIGQKFYKSDQILYTLQHLFFRAESTNTPEWHAQIGLGRLSLTGNIDEYDLPLFFVTYTGTTALDIAELNFIDLRLYRQFQLNSSMSIDFAIEQIIPFRIVKTTSSQSNSTEEPSPEPSPEPTKKTSTESGWGGLKIYTSLIYRF